MTSLLLKIYKMASKGVEYLSNCIDRDVFCNSTQSIENKYIKNYTSILLLMVLKLVLTAQKLNTPMMTDDHLLNCINLFSERNVDATIYIEECKRRKLKMRL